MKHQLIPIALSLVIGIGIGVAVERVLATTGRNEPGKGQFSATQLGPRASMKAGVDRRGMSKARSRAQLDRNALATIRRVSKQLEMSPMIGTDLEALLQVYEQIRWMNPEDVQMALGELANMNQNPMMRRNAMLLQSLLVSLWAKQDGKGAMEYASSLKQPMEMMQCVMNGMMTWMKHDPGTAYQWYKENRDSMKGIITWIDDGMLLSALAQHDMDTAFRELIELNENNRITALSTMARSMGMDDAKREKFIEQLEKLDDKTLRDSGMASMIGPWAITDPQSATGYLEKMDPKPENYELLIESAASGWGATDPESAIQWLLENTGDNQVDGDKIADTFGTWAMNDSESAEKWLAEQPEGFATDRLYSQAASKLNFMDPERATQWAVKIEDVDIRRAALLGLYSSMQSQGEEAFLKWMDGLDPEICKEVAGVCTPYKEELQGNIPEAFQLAE